MGSSESWSYLTPVLVCLKTDAYQGDSNMEYPQETLLYLTLLVTLASSRTVNLTGLLHNKNIVKCGEEYCGYQAECVDETCQCDRQRGEIRYKSKNNIKINYCLGICNPEKCQDNETCVEIKNKRHRCSCARGYQFSLYGQCLDIDECETPDRCGFNSVCLNTDGNYTCECKEGYRRSGKGSLGCTGHTGKGPPTTNDDSSDDDDSMTLTISLALGLGGLSVLILVIVVFVVWRRKTAPQRGREALEITQREANTETDSHINDSAVDAQLTL